MSNKYTEGAASVLLHLHAGPDKTGHGVHHEFDKPAQCPECLAPSDDIVTNDLPAHHIEYTCRCLKCDFEWMPNSDD